MKDNTKLITIIALITLFLCLPAVLKVVSDEARSTAIATDDESCTEDDSCDDVDVCIDPERCEYLRPKVLKLTRGSSFRIP